MIFLKRIANRMKLLCARFLPSETIARSKEKWDGLSRENARYYVLSDQGEDISEEAFRKAGEDDFKKLVLDDLVLREKVQEGGVVLEIGCGIGRITEFFANHFKFVHAIDISKKMVEAGRKRLEFLKNVELIETNGVDYPFSSETFDLIFSFIVFQHMPDKDVIEKNIIEVGRVLKGNGIAKIQFRGTPVIKGQWFYGYSVTPKEIEVMAKKANLRIIKQEGIGRKYYWVWFSK